MRNPLTFAYAKTDNKLQQAFSICLKDLSVIFINKHIPFTIDDMWIGVGGSFDVKDWMIYLSSRTALLSAVIEKVIPVLLETGVPFRVVKNEEEAYNMNAGLYGMHMVGKVIQVAPRSLDEAVALCNMLRAASKGCKGCLIQDSIRLGDIVYVQQLLPGHIPKSRFPFLVEEEYRKTAYRRIIGRYYIPLTVLSRSCKGVTYIGLKLKFPFKWCLIKQGNVNTADDHFGRDIKDRLLWQKKVLEDLEGTNITSQVYDFAEYKDFYFLIMEYMDGAPLSEVISNIRNGRSWDVLAAGEKRGILQLYFKALEKVNSLHKRGYVHRDIVGRNMIVRKSGELRLIDFEMACNIRNAEPSPPFTLGTPGYIAPEQVSHMEPGFPEDIYSMGALLLSLVTGNEPAGIIAGDEEQTRQSIQKMVDDAALQSIILSMLAIYPGDRSPIESIMSTISNYIAALNNDQ